MEKDIILATKTNLEMKLQEFIERNTNRIMYHSIRTSKVKEIEFEMLKGLKITQKVTQGESIYEETSTIDQMNKGVIYF